MSIIKSVDEGIAIPSGRIAYFRWVGTGQVAYNVDVTTVPDTDGLSERPRFILHTRKFIHFEHMVYFVGVAEPAAIEGQQFTLDDTAEAFLDSEIVATMNQDDLADIHEISRRYFRALGRVRRLEREIQMLQPSGEDVGGLMEADTQLAALRRDHEQRNQALLRRKAELENLVSGYDKTITKPRLKISELSQDENFWSNEAAEFFAKLMEETYNDKEYSGI